MTKIKDIFFLKYKNLSDVYKLLKWFFIAFLVLNWLLLTIPSIFLGISISQAFLGILRFGLLNPGVDLSATAKGITEIVQKLYVTSKVVSFFPAIVLLYVLASLTALAVKLSKNSNQLNLSQEFSINNKNSIKLFIPIVVIHSLFIIFWIILFSTPLIVFINIPGIGYIRTVINIVFIVLSIILSINIAKNLKWMKSELQPKNEATVEETTQVEVIDDSQKDEK
ncbi:hypothetical protein C4M96_00450 [Mycoplasmopsis pullorum]|uniref:hypothetical protein n=1 Tax=Mycoplasmopsis pullorum TaxID=48003 RepID=UPI001118418D|nr:hypothetical protein [Mycoplasmopsis pullorum]TNK83299.1 hypothetical protein C4M93_02640 [Mycoplasmopsis pullorum]TNK92506.1 hypothetical protein C4M96_00450 [Mycoplasmopsis pullorum]